MDDKWRKSKVATDMPDDITRGGKERRKSTQAHLDQAAELEEQGLLHEAVVELRKALRGSSEKPAIYKKLADLYRRQRRSDEAISAMRKAIKLAPDDMPARETLLEMLLDLSRFDDVIKESNNLLQISPRSVPAREALSTAYLQQGILEKALRITNELISLDPTSPGNHFRRAWLYQQKGDLGSAIHEFTRVLEMHPDTEMAQDAQRAIDTLDSYQLRHIVMLAVEDYIFRAKLIRDPEAAAAERGYYLSYAGLASLKQIQFDELPDIYAEWKQRYYH